jgi:hypothetical protein
VFLTLAVDGGKWSASRSSERVHRTHWIEGRWAPEPVWTRLRGEKFSARAGNWAAVVRALAQSLYWLSYHICGVVVLSGFSSTVLLRCKLLFLYCTHYRAFDIETHNRYAHCEWKWKVLSYGLVAIKGFYTKRNFHISVRLFKCSNAWCCMHLVSIRTCQAEEPKATRHPYALTCQCFHAPLSTLVFFASGYVQNSCGIRPCYVSYVRKMYRAWQCYLIQIWPCSFCLTHFSTC